MISLSALRSFCELANGEKTWKKIRNSKMLRVMKIDLTKYRVQSYWSDTISVYYEITVTLQYISCVHENCFYDLSFYYFHAGISPYTDYRIRKRCHHSK